MEPTPFARLAELAERLAATRSRLELTELVADFLRQLPSVEVAPAVRLLLGQPFPTWDPRALNMSWHSVSRVMSQLTAASAEQQRRIAAVAVDGGDAVQKLLEIARKEPPSPPPLLLSEVYQALERIAELTGSGSRQGKEKLLRGILSRASPVEAKYVVKNVIAEMRHGVNEGLMLEAIAVAAQVKPDIVRRAYMLWGDLGEIASVALGQGPEALQKASIRLFRPLQPMLAQTAETVEEAFERHGGKLALEYKLDGARVQIHKRGQEVRIYSRQLAEVTPSLPELVEWAQSSISAEEAIVEGEAIAIDEQGRPLPFQHLMRRFRRQHDVAQMRRDIPIALYLFDLLYADGVSYVDRGYEERWQALGEIAGGLQRATRIVTQDIEEAKRFLRQAVEAGHEGVMAKQLTSPYTPGVRGHYWLKLKHASTLDLCIVAADWGYGRRHGWLSNYHLAAWDAERGEFAVVGKTFKGLTDEEFQAMTEKLLALEVRRQGGTVFVQPRIVVEVLYNELQASPQYESGLALRFARIVRLREDKGPEEIDTLQSLRQLFQRQFRYKGSLAAHQKAN